MGHWELPRAATAVRHLLEAADEAGIARETCLAGTRLTSERIGDPTSEIAVWQELSVARNLARALPDTTGLGVHLGQRVHLSAYGPAALALLASATPREAFEIARRFSGLLVVVSRTSLSRAAGSTSLTFDASLLPTEAHRLLLERDLLATITAVAELIGRTTFPMELDLEFPADGSTELWRQAADVTPRFAARQTRLTMSNEFLDSPLPQADSYSFRLAVDECEDLVRRRRSRLTVADQVRERLRSGIDHHVPTIEQVAGALLTTVRTLRRRLDAEGTSFRALADDVRRGIAVDLLTTHRLTVQQVAARLGYADASAFSHAFKRWTGIGPAAYRNLVGRDGG